jgi:hypothetical protein
MYFYQPSFGGSIPDMLAAVFFISLAAVFSEVLTAENMAAKLALNILLNIICFGLYLISLNRSAKNLPLNWEKIRRAVA